jgi:hypothetical protein
MSLLRVERGSVVATFDPLLDVEQARRHAADLPFGDHPSAAAFALIERWTGITITEACSLARSRRSWCRQRRRKCCTRHKQRCEGPSALAREVTTIPRGRPAHCRVEAPPTQAAPSRR